MRLLNALYIAVLIQIPFGCSRPQSPLCDLLKNPEKYNGKEVTVRATWRHGFEWSQFYCLDCLDKGMVWLVMPGDTDEASAEALRAIPRDAGIANLTVQGVFMSGGGFGHFNKYPFRLMARRVSDVKAVFIQSGNVMGMKEAAKEKEAEKRWACGGQNPR